MSQHVIMEENKKFVFGWDQPLMSFFLQVHNLTLDEDDEECILFVAGTPPNVVYDVEDLVNRARRYGCHIPYQTQIELYREQDDGD